MPTLTELKTDFAPRKGATSAYIIGNARERFLCRDECIAYIGKKGTSKTYTDLALTDYLCHKYPGSRHLWVRDTKASCKDTVIYTFENFILNKDDVRNPDISWANREDYQYHNTSYIAIYGLDKPDRLQGTEWDTEVVFETTVGVTENQYELLTGLLRSPVMPYKQICCEGNPGGSNHWLIRRIRKGEFTLFTAEFEDNPTITQKYIDRLSKMTGHRRQRLYEGLWASAEGQVYPGLLDCVIPIPNPEGQTRFEFYDVPDNAFLCGGVDFGWEHLTVFIGFAVWLADDGKWKARIVYERLAQRRPIEWWAEVIPEGFVWACDHDPERIMKLRRAGHACKKAEKSVSAGVEVANKWIESGNLSIPRNMKGIINQGSNLIYHPTKEDTPVKEQDDAPDAFRYGLRLVDRYVMSRERFGGSE